MRRLALVAIGLAFLLSGCGSSNYAKTFNDVVPSTWTQISSSGSVKLHCGAGVDCGHVVRTYQYDSSPQQAATDFLKQLQTRQCAGIHDGGGVSADCSNGVHLSVSFTGNTASVELSLNTNS